SSTRRTRRITWKGFSARACNSCAAISHAELARRIGADARVLTMVDPPLVLTLDLHHSARALAQDHRLSFYDALIVSTSIEAGCDTLFSEHMQHGRSIGGLAIVNPFLDSAP